MIKITDIVDDRDYVVDLIQFDSGHRTLRVRNKESPQYPKTALSSKPYRGEIIRLALQDFRRFAGIKLETDASFTVDPHTVWMTTEEMAYHVSHPNPEDDMPGAPWINGLRPQFAPL